MKAEDYWDLSPGWTPGSIQVPFVMEMHSREANQLVGDETNARKMSKIVCTFSECLHQLFYSIDYSLVLILNGLELQLFSVFFNDITVF